MRLTTLAAAGLLFLIVQAEVIAYAQTEMTNCAAAYTARQHESQMYDSSRKYIEQMRAKGCVPLTDQIYATNPPSFDWVCPK